MVRTMQVNAETLRRQSTEGFTLATEAADWLARQGVPFAEAHEVTGRMVRFCEERRIDLFQLTAADLEAIDPRLDPAILPHLSPEAAVAARAGHGGTAPAQVARQLERLRQSIDRRRAWAGGYRGPRP
jgi:argininosuccinate lyase